MTTVASLSQRDFQAVGHLFVIEGISTAWTDIPELEGRSGVGTWIGSDPSDPGRKPSRVSPGLELSEGFTAGTNLLEGMLRESPLTVTLVDYTDELIALIAEPDRDYAYQRISPLDDPAPSTVIGQGGDNVDVWGRQVNGESIGNAGERRQYPIIPGSTLPGRDHAAFESTEQTIPPSIITDSADLFAGNRRCAVYVIRKDVDSGLTGAAAWPHWTDQYESGMSLRWWGTLDRVSAVGPTYTLDCKGPESLLRQQINTTSPAQWLSVGSRLQLSDEEGQREDLIAVAFQYRHYEQVALDERCGFSLFDPTDDVITSDQDVDGVLGQVADRLATLASTAGPDQTWDSYRNGKYKFSKDGLSLRVDDGAPALGGEIAICMHLKVWQFLGYDPIEQARAYAEIETARDIHFIKCVESFQAWDGAKATIPGDDYYVGYFGTWPLGTSPGTAGVTIDNNGSWRGYQPLTDAGVVLLDPDAQQEIAVSFSSGVPYATGQLARPVADHVMESGDACDATGWMVFRGKYRASLQSDPETRYAVAKVSWVNVDNAYQVDDTGYAKVWIEKWIDPRIPGFRVKPFDKTWAALDLECSTLAVLGYNTGDVDAMHLVLLRLLLSTGTKVWDAGSYEDKPDAHATPGANHHPDASGPHSEGDDQDIADLGLAVPHELVAWRSFIDAANALPGGGYKSGLNQGKIAMHGAKDAQDLIHKILKPRAWFLGLDGGKYSLWSMTAPISVEDATVNLTDADLDTDAVPYIPEVDLRPLAGFDKVSIEYHYPPVEGAGDTARIDAVPLSPRSRGRSGNAECTMEGLGLIDRSLWAGADGGPPEWGSAWREHTEFLADYLLAPHVMLLNVPIEPPKSYALFPGTVVTVSNAWVPTRAGSYGLTAAVGRVVNVRYSFLNHRAAVDILVQAGDAYTARRFAPIAAVLDDVDTLEERHDEDTRTLYCYADVFGAEGGSDVAWFVEPAWSEIGGDALVYGYQYDGRLWRQEFTFEVESVDTAAHSITYVDGSWTGTFYERKYTILTLAPYDDQTAAWPRSLFVVNTGANGKFGATKGFEFQP